jgi:cephalosporin-C deacetylase-like acetyl esterase
MTKFFLLFFTCMLFLAGKAQKKTEQVHLNDQWKFRAGDDPAWAQPQADESAWTTVSTRQILEDQKGFEAFEGFGWYRTKLTLPASLKAAVQRGGGLVLNYGKVDDCDELYVNGHFVGRSGSFPPSYQSAYGKDREYNVPLRFLFLDKPNIIAVRLYDGGGGGGIVSAGSFARNITTFDKVAMQVTVADDDYIFDAPKPLTLTVALDNQNTTAFPATLQVEVTTDDFKPVQSLKQTFTLATGAKTSKTFTLKAKPGFYRYTVYLQSGGEKGKPVKLNIGYEPEKIRGFPDKPADFGSFWQSSLKAMAGVNPDFQMVAKPGQSTADYDIFEVSMNSFGGERVTGVYARPKREGRFPVSIEYQGYSEGPRMPSLQWDGFAHMVMCIRGQGYNKEGHKYGDWIVYGLQSKEDYYYRGAYLDAVRGIDFVCSRPEIDTTRIVAQGGSQGGALTFAAAALDRRIKACAPGIPFLSDYRNYFKIVPWPRSSFETYRKEHPEVSWEHIYKVLAYFDIKNLASRITCPLFMGIGVQDNVCPPHINFAAYNEVKGPKKWIAYPLEGHSTGPDFPERRLAFFKEKLGIRE